MPKQETMQGLDGSDEIYRYFKGIFDRQYYTESGPLVRELENFLKDKIHKKNVVCISNASICWLMLLGLRFECQGLVLPTKISYSLREAINWLGFSIEIYNSLDDLRSKDIKEGSNSKTIVLSSVRSLDSVVRKFGMANALDKGRFLIDTEDVYFDKLDTLTSSQDWALARVLNFDIDGHGYGACICTDNDELADELRCMRSSGGVVNKLPVKRTVNGRMSEAQAAFVHIQAKNSQHP